MDRDVAERANELAAEFYVQVGFCVADGQASMMRYFEFSALALGRAKPMRYHILQKSWT